MPLVKCIFCLVKVFVLSIFEVEYNITALPHDKHELLQMLGNKSAIPFHKYVCSDCHRIPRAKEWMTTPFVPGQGLKVFHVGKRHKPYHHWEPIYIGTKRDPLYDERLSWEGRSDKMTQVRKLNSNPLYSTFTLKYFKLGLRAMRVGL